MKSDIGATMGTCLSNQALRRLKCENIREFVRAVQPGLLYIHGLDISSRDGAKGAWATRCPECRRARKQQRSERQNGPREMFDAVCAACGKATKVPFQPKNDKPVYCSECFAKRRGR